MSEIASKYSETALARRGEDIHWDALSLSDFQLLLVRLSVDRQALHSSRGRLLARCETMSALLRKRRLDSVPYLGLEDVPAPIGLERWLWQMQRLHLLEVVRLCDKRHVTVLVTKGAEMCERFFGSQPVGRKADVDIMVRKADEATVRQVLHELGFTQANFDPTRMELVACSDEELQKHESNSYNLKSFAKLIDITGTPHAQQVSDSSYPLFSLEGRAIALVVVDVSFGFDKSIDIEPIFARSIPSAFPLAQTLSLEDHLWQLCSHFYLRTFFRRSEVKLSLLCEIAAILWCSHANLDWDYLADQCAKYDLYPYIYYNAAVLDTLLGLGLGQSLLERFDPRRGSRLRDFGWQITRAFDEIDTFPKALLHHVQRENEPR